MTLQDTSTNLQTSPATGLEKYANVLIIQGKRKKKPPACFTNSLTQMSVHRGEQVTEDDLGLKDDGVDETTGVDSDFFSQTIRLAN